MQNDTFCCKIMGELKPEKGDWKKPANVQH